MSRVIPWYRVIGIGKHPLDMLLCLLWGGEVLRMFARKKMIVSTNPMRRHTELGEEFRVHRHLGPLHIDRSGRIPRRAFPRPFAAAERAAPHRAALDPLLEFLGRLRREAVKQAGHAGEALGRAGQLPRRISRSFSRAQMRWWRGSIPPGREPGGSLRPRSPAPASSDRRWAAPCCGPSRTVWPC
jgi:hypothetical protein